MIPDDLLGFTEEKRGAFPPFSYFNLTRIKFFRSNAFSHRWGVLTALWAPLEKDLPCPVLDHSVLRGANEQAFNFDFHFTPTPNYKRNILAFLESITFPDSSPANRRWSFREQVQLAKDMKDEVAWVIPSIGALCTCFGSLLWLTLTLCSQWLISETWSL